jgi:hypothetical protein
MKKYKILHIWSQNAFIFCKTQQMDHFTGQGATLSIRQGTNTKQKGRIYDRFLKVHGDKEDADIIKN